jgi:hypothetical protein
MSEERRKILNMLAEGKISATDAEKLLDALNKPEPAETEEKPAIKQKMKCLKIEVEPKGDSKKEKVKIKIPLQIIRAGIKLGSILPPGDAKNKVNEALREKGISLDVNGIKGDSIENIIESLAEMKINIDDDKEIVRIFCE